MSLLPQLAAILSRVLARRPTIESPDDDLVGDAATLDRADVAALRAPHTEPI